MRLPWLAQVLRDAGLTVVETRAWQQRGRDLGSIQGIVWHHTATGPRTPDANVVDLLIEGRSDLPGPLCQLGLDRSGRYHLIAAGKGNHNGYGEWGNSSIGIEAFNDGVGEPWPQAQVDAYIRGTAALLARLGLPASRVKGHKETDPRRKIDPRGLDMDEMRGRVTAALHGEGDEFDMASLDDLKAVLGEWEKDTREQIIAAVTKRIDAQTDQIDRFTVWQMRQAGVPDAEISRILGKKKLPPAA